MVLFSVGWCYLVWDGLIYCGVVLLSVGWPYLVWDGVIKRGMVLFSVGWSYLVWHGLIKRGVVIRRGVVLFSVRWSSCACERVYSASSRTSANTDATRQVPTAEKKWHTQDSQSQILALSA